METKDQGRPRISRRTMLKGLAGSAAAAALAACSPEVVEQIVTVEKVVTVEVEVEVQGEPPADGAVEITWASHIYEPWNNALAAQGMQFMSENPDIKIVYSPIPFEELNTKFMTAFASGNPYNIMGIYGPWMPQFVSGGNLDPAPDDYVQDIELNFPPIIKESALFEGSVYGYVQHIGIPAPVLNVDLWEAAGVAEPSTFDEALAAMAVLDKKDADGNWEQLGCTLATTRGVWLMIHYGAFLMSYGGQYMTEDNQVAFNTDEAVEALNLYANFAHPDAPEQAWYLGKVGMVWDGPWAKSAYNEQAPELNYKAILSFEGPAGRVQGSYVWFWAISSIGDPAQKKATWDFCKWLSAPTQYAAQYRAIGQMPITKELPPEYADDPWLQAFNENLKYARLYYSKYEKWEQVELLVSEELERFCLGEITAQEALQNGEDKVNKLLAEG